MLYSYVSPDDLEKVIEVAGGDVGAEKLRAPE